jgi:GNAT superfamily N-acetyltransferase
MLTETQLDDIASPVLLDRAKVGAGGVYTKLYVGRVDDQEVALLVVDFWPPPEPLRVYEIFVVDPARREGVGSELLLYAEQLAVQSGNTEVELHARSLDDRIRTSILVAWYRRRGYARQSTRELMRKRVVAGRRSKRRSRARSP